MEALGEIDLAVCAVQSQDLHLGLDKLQEMGQEQDIPLTCANLVDAEGSALFPGHRIFELGDKRLGVLSVTDPKLQHAARNMPGGLQFEDPALAVATGVEQLKQAEGCDAVVLLYGGRRDQALDACKEIEGLDLVLFGNATISQRVPAETDMGTLVYTAAARGKDFGELTMTLKDDGSTEVSPIMIHELDKHYPDDPMIEAMVEEYNASKVERKKRAQLIEQLAQEFSETETTDNFLGTDACKRCHLQEYDSFMESAHAHALVSLEKEYEENNPDCVACHVTGWGKPGGYGLDKRNRDLLKHVQCEACHGYGTAHQRDESIDTAAAEMEASCLTCHDEENSPEFDFNSYWQKIAH